MNTVLSLACRYSRVFALALGSIVAPALTTASNAYPPNGMTYQGYLVDANGTPLAPTTPANYDAVFRIYSASTGGTSLWSEKQTVTVDNGQFSVVLGEGGVVTGEPHGLISSVFASGDASDRFVGITVTIGSSALEIVPRLKFLASPYAYLAQNAAGLVNPDGYAVQLAKLDTDQTLTGINTFAGAANFNGIATFNGAANFNGLIASSASITNAILGATTINGNVNVAGTVTATAFSGPIGGSVPVGGVIMWSGTIANIPTNWALCDGSQGTPNLQGRFVLDSGVQSDLGSTGGNATITISTVNLPPHSHQYVDSGFQPGGYGEGTGQWYSWGPTGIGLGGAYGTLGHATSVNSNTGNTGSGASIYSMPPYYIMAYIMRIR